MAEDDQEYRRQMAAHNSRKEKDFIPYWCRPSDGYCGYHDNGDDSITVTMNVLDLGTITITVTPRYSHIKQRLWNQDAVLKMAIK